MYNYIPQIERLRRAENFFRFGTISNNNITNAKIDKHGNAHSERNGRFISKYSYDGQKEMMTKLSISCPEFMKIVSEINTLYSPHYKKQKTFKHYSGNFKYTITNHGFNNYEFRDKILIGKTIHEE